jgi:MarR family transcriptional regulator, organic hydroperoxide resistance regulator
MVVIGLILKKTNYFLYQYLYIQINYIIFDAIMKSSESKYCRCLYFSANALARKAEKLARKSWRPVGLSPSHAYLLMLVIDDPGIQPGMLGEQLQLSPSTITRLMAKLEKQKLLIRIFEGRIANAYPTPKGKALKPNLDRAFAHFYKVYSEILGKEESRVLVRNMNTVSDQL